MPPTASCISMMWPGVKALKRLATSHVESRGAVLLRAVRICCGVLFFATVVLNDSVADVTLRTVFLPVVWLHVTGVGVSRTGQSPR